MLLRSIIHGIGDASESDGEAEESEDEKERRHGEDLEQWFGAAAFGVAQGNALPIELGGLDEAEDGEAGVANSQPEPADSEEPLEYMD